MTISEERYRDCVQVTCTWPDDPQAMLRNGTQGLRRIAQTVEARLITDEMVDRVQLRAQVGELFWHYTLLLTALDMSLQEVMAENMRQLCVRFPDNQAIQILVRRYPGLPGMESEGEPHAPPVPRVIPRRRKPRTREAR